MDLIGWVSPAAKKAREHRHIGYVSDVASREVIEPRLDA
jgi:hypothetical protein